MVCAMSASTIRAAAAVLLAAVLATGCSGRWRPSERACYTAACDAIAALPDLPQGAKPLPIEQSRLYIGKNAARVDVAMDLAAPDGSRGVFYTAWLKRLGRRWVVDRPAYPTDRPPPGQ